MIKNTKAFTLVELVVTLTILAILGVISFFSFQGYSRSSRDSIRIADISSVKNSLEIYSIVAGKYPLPTDSQSITYSGGIVWEQGTFGETTFNNVEKLNKIPTDPLFDKEYTYSVTINRNQYLLGGISENSNFTNSNLINESYAGDVIMNALVVGNYNGLVTKVQSGDNCIVVNVPTIITNDIETSTNYEDIINNKSLVFNGFENIPGVFKNTKLDINGGFDYTPNTLIIYSDNNSCKVLENDEILRINLLKSVQDSYSGTILKDKYKYSQLLGLDINSGSLDNSVIIKGLAGNIGKIVLGKDVKISYLIDPMSGLCRIDGETIDNGGIITAYSENSIDELEIYDCQSVSQERTCEGGVLSGEEIYGYSSCIKGIATNCSSTTGYIYNTHSYNIPALNHLEGTGDLISQQVNEYNGVSTYTLNNVLCNDGTFINFQESSSTIVECDNGYFEDGGSCISEGTVTILSGDTVACPYCTQ